MRVRPAGNKIQPAFFQRFAHNFGILDNLRRIFLKLRGQIFAKTYRFCRNHMHQRTTLRSRKDSGINFLGNLGIIRQNHAAARAAQRFVGRRRYHVRPLQGIRMLPAGNQTGKMGHVNHQISANLIGNLPKTCKIHLPRIS